MSLRIAVQNREPGCFVVQLGGKLDTTTYQACQEKVRPLLTSQTKVLMFDMKDLQYISSLGLQVIVRACLAVEKSGGRYVLASLQPQIAKVFEIARSLPTGRLFASVKEADDYLAAIQSQELKRQKGVDKEGEDEEV